MFRKCFREPISEIFQAAAILHTAVDCHNSGNISEAKKLFTQANNIEIKKWVESIIGKNSPYIQYNKIPENLPTIPKENRASIRMPNAEEKGKIHIRDGYFCRFCGIPVIRPEIRNKITKAYLDEVPWGKTNISRHSAFFAMWAQYDHIIPHARGGDNSLENLVLTCTACNFGRMNYTLDEVGILYPDFLSGSDNYWKGLENFK